MKDFILLMHGDAKGVGDWEAYLASLRARGVFDGGSSIGEGICCRKNGHVPETTRQLTGYIRMRAESLEAAKDLLAGNPVYEAGGTVEIRELPRD